MSDADPIDLRQRLAGLGKTLGEREAPHRAELEAAQARAESLRKQVAEGLEAFHQSVASAGAPHLQVLLSPIRADDKHLRSVEFDLERGRHRAIVTVKSRGDVTLVGPFKAGKQEGPCKSFPFGAEPELSGALAGFLEQFLEEASTP